MLRILSVVRSDTALVRSERERAYVDGIVGLGSSVDSACQLLRGDPKGLAKVKAILLVE